jgi:hypothetical protein
LFELEWLPEAERAYGILKNDAALEKRYKAVKETLKFLAMNPRHPSLQTHEYVSLKGLNGEKVFEAYAQHKTPAAYRVFWYYGPGRHVITVFAITSHP